MHIKPGNLVVVGKTCYIVDFGLVIYPGKLILTGVSERIGPFWTMAPEVRREHAAADPFPGDVYALAKTLWSILRGENYAFDGQFASTPELSIQSLFPESYMTPLEALLSEATDNNVGNRPTMKEFSERLDLWLKHHDDFVFTNPLQWEEILSNIFPYGMPRIAEWTEPEKITQILNLLGRPNLNHTFYPSGGGNDLSSARLSKHEPGCLEFEAISWSLVKVKRLVFHGFAGDTEWSYFRLEGNPLDPCGVYETTPDYVPTREEVTRISNEVYADLNSWDSDAYQGKSLPDGAHPITRWFGGSFVIFRKSSFYNLVGGRLDAYDGRHNKMTDELFYEHISEMRTMAHEKQLNLAEGRYANRTPRTLPIELP